MFTIDNDPKFSHDVKVQVPVNGGHREETIKATYRVLPVDEVEKLDLQKLADTQKFLQAVLVRLDDMVDANRQPVPYSDEVRDQVLRLPYVRVALADAYFTAVAKARLGN